MLEAELLPHLVRVDDDPRRVGAYLSLERRGSPREPWHGHLAAERVHGPRIAEIRYEGDAKPFSQPSADKQGGPGPSGCKHYIRVSVPTDPGKSSDRGTKPPAL